MPSRHALRDSFQSLTLSLISLALFTACSSSPIHREQSDPSARAAFLLPEDPSLSEEEWNKKALALALTGGPTMVRTLCEDDQKAYACNFIADACENGNAGDCRALAVLGYQDERYKYYRLACNFEDAESCKLVKDMESKTQRGLAGEVEAVQDANAISTAEFLDNWKDGAIDRFIGSKGGAPARIITMGEGKTLYEFVDNRKAISSVNILEPVKCTIQLFVESGRIYRWKLSGNAGACLN